MIRFHRSDISGIQEGFRYQPVYLEEAFRLISIGGTGTYRVLPGNGQEKVDAAAHFRWKSHRINTLPAPFGSFPGVLIIEENK